MSTIGGEEPKTRPTFRGALKRLRLAWKVNGLFLLILAAALGISRFLANLDLERAGIEAARDTHTHAHTRTHTHTHTHYC